MLSGSGFGPSPPYFAKHVPCGLFPLLPMIRRPPWPLSAPSGADLSLYASRPFCTMHVLIYPSDVWDHRFLMNGCQGATVHHSDKAPTSVLDLGCGSGYWAIEAAKQWPVCLRASLRAFASLDHRTASSLALTCCAYNRTFITYKHTNIWLTE